jgi:hypothetical protein
MGKPIELMGQALPAFASQAITTATSKGLEVVLKGGAADNARKPLEPIRVHDEAFVASRLNIIRILARRTKVSPAASERPMSSWDLVNLPFFRRTDAPTGFWLNR